MKILLVVIVIAVIYFVFFRKAQKIGDNQHTNAISDKEDIMAECKKCGVYISNKEAIIKDGDYYCSKECGGVK